MFYHARGGNIHVGNSNMDYISFGSGSQILVMLPGLSDGLSTLKGKALIFAMAYRMYAKKYTVYVFSRKNHLPEGYSTREMTKDQAEAMIALGISKADVLGVSQGGMIAQYLAIDYPDLVGKLILAVTASKPNEIVQEAINTWLQMAVQEDYKNLMIDTAERSYSQCHLKKYGFLYPLLGRIGKPKSFNRFLIQAASCAQHNAYSELDKIVCPTLVIGGACDKIVGTAAASELSEKIRGSELFIYENLGHAAYEEAKDFNDRCLNFLSN
ncbi:MAG: alpha/beta hydrolase [Lachnospiraceae bacterium]|nr:alpha/beta hydrolase [Lachnospiraceae bacterium]MDE6184906.1 alpha/beta hydrolase [Lachnospiraceae bacterium]